MEDRPKLTVVKNLKALTPRVFVGCCPEGDVTAVPHDEKNCQWWLNSAEHQFCFWRYVRDKSDPDGAMRELVQSELAQLFGWSNTKTHFMLKQAMVELTDALKLYGAVELLEGLSEDEVESIVNLDASERFQDDLE